LLGFDFILQNMVGDDGNESQCAQGENVPERHAFDESAIRRFHFLVRLKNFYGEGQRSFTHFDDTMICQGLFVL
jgi:hypothetical protein